MKIILVSLFALSRSYRILDMEQTDENQEVDTSNRSLSKIKIEREHIENGIEDEVIESLPVIPKICNFDFKEMFVEKKGRMTPEVGFRNPEEFQEFCNNLERSCCSKEELRDLFGKVSEGFEDFEYNIKELPKMVDLLDKLNEIKIDDFIDQNENLFEQCFYGHQSKKDKRWMLLKMITDLQEELEDFKQNYSKYVKKIFQSQFKLQCGFCDFNNSNFFDFDKDNEKPFKVIA